MTYHGPERGVPVAQLIEAINGTEDGLRPQAQFLRQALERRRLSPREVSWRSAMLAQELGLPTAAFTRQAVSAWLNGTRTPRAAHRRVLALILQISVEELDRTGQGPETLSSRALFREVTVKVFGKKNRPFEYNLTLSSGVNLSQPAIYRSWTEMFLSPPDPLRRHFRASRHKLFGWIPDDSARPIIRRYPCLVPLQTERLHLQSESTDQRRIWFVTTPDRRLQIGIAYLKDRSIILVSRGGSLTTKYPFSAIDLVGYVNGDALFQIQDRSRKDDTLNGATKGHA